MATLLLLFRNIKDIIPSHSTFATLHETPSNTTPITTPTSRPTSISPRSLVIAPPTEAAVSNHDLFPRPDSTFTFITT